MRALALPCLLAGACLSSPTGRDPGSIDASPDGTIDGMGAAWPPPAANILAIAAGDLDNDTRDDIIALDAGSSRVFLLRGGVDIDPTRIAVTTTSDSAPLVGLRAPAEVIVALNGGQKFVVVLDNPAPGARFTVFNPQLDMVSQAMAGPPAANLGQSISLAQTSFGMGMNAVFGSVPDAVFFFEGTQLPMSNLPVMLLPEAGATAFANVLAVGGYVAAGAPPAPRVFVSEPTLAQRADAVGAGQFNWTTVRPAANTWSAQVVADVTGDSYGDVVGFAPEGGAQADICVLDVQMGSAPACYDTPFGMDAVQMAVGPVLAPNQSDVVLINPNPQMPSMTGIFVVARVRISGTVQADSASPPLDVAVQDAMLALAQLDGGGKEIIVVGKNGTIACARPNGASMPMRCAP